LARRKKKIKKKADDAGLASLIEAYRRWLPVTDQTPVVTLREGATPLIPAPSLAEAHRTWRSGSFLKYDGPQSHRQLSRSGMTMAVSKATRSGAEAVHSWRQHRQHLSPPPPPMPAARHAGLCESFPDGYVCPRGKLAQALVYGAECWPLKGNFDRAFRSCASWPIAIGHPG